MLEVGRKPLRHAAEHLMIAIFSNQSSSLAKGLALLSEITFGGAWRRNPHHHLKSARSYPESLLKSGSATDPSRPSCVVVKSKVLVGDAQAHGTALSSRDTAEF